MRHNYSGQCKCGAVRLEVRLPKPLDAYAPRQCDCDWCMARHAAFLSDPEGEVTYVSATALAEERQGDQIAAMLHCSDCGDFLGPSGVFDGQRKGAIRVGLLSEAARCAPAQIVQPRLLSPDEKITRWRQVWMQVTHKLQAS